MIFSNVQLLVFIIYFPQKFGIYLENENTIMPMKETAFPYKTIIMLQKQ